MSITLDSNPYLTHLLSIAAGMYNDLDFSGQDEDSDALSNKIQSDIYEIESNQCLNNGQGKI